MPKYTKEELKKLTDLAKEIREKGGSFEIKKYKLGWRECVAKAAKQLKCAGPKLPKKK